MDSLKDHEKLRSKMISPFSTNDNHVVQEYKIFNQKILIMCKSPIHKLLKNNLFLGTFNTNYVYNAAICACNITNIKNFDNV